MDPLTNIQVTIKNNVDIFYFACIAPLHIFFSEDGNYTILSNSSLLLL